jgi:hypothetical protein
MEGRLLAIMEAFSPEKKGYYEWSVENLGRNQVEVDHNILF